MSDTLKEIHNKFGHSKAIFRKTHNDGKSITFECSGKYDPKSADLDHSDPAVKMMVECYSEYFDKQSLYEALDNSGRVLQNMFFAIKEAFLYASPLKNPQQSKLYKWLEFGTINHPNNREGIVALYRYMAKNTDSSRRFEGGPNNPHAKNLVAILEKLKEKYERK